MHPVNHPLTGKPDKRWSVNPEWTGQPEQQYVIRFMREWVTSRPTLDAAIEVAKKQAERGVP